MENKIPIYAGCSNGICCCTGACKEIIGYREPHPLEKEQIDKNAFSKFLNGNSDVCNLDSVNGKGTFITAVNRPAEEYVNNPFTKLSNEVLYELWDNKHKGTNVLWFIDRNGIIKRIICYFHRALNDTHTICEYVIVWFNNKFNNGKIIKSNDEFDKFVEKHKNTIFFRTGQEAKNYLKSLTI